MQDFNDYINHQKIMLRPCLLTFTRQEVRSECQRLEKELQLGPMLELQVLVHVRVVCHLQARKGVAICVFFLLKFPNHLLVANETNISIAEPAFVCCDKL